MGEGFWPNQKAAPRGLPRTEMLEFRARNRTPSGSGMRHCTLNCIALHKIDMIGVLSVRCPENGHSHALSLRKSKLPA